MSGGFGAETLRPGQKLGRYTLLTPVGQGGMARVWAARQVGMRGFQRIVAIKTIMPDLAADPEFERMFLDEARIASAVHHPNVCEIVDLGEEGKTLFLAMEWVEGVSLLSLFKARPHMPLPDPVAVRIIADACAGLHAAHELRDETGQLIRVVHRDVSPHNILVSQEGHVKVADFGVAKAMGLEHAPTTAGQLKGKVAYMSPEQAVGETVVDRRSDIFSLGAVLYEAITGQRAWTGANDVARLQNLLAGNIIPARQVRPDIPQDLEAILAYSLATDPNRRFQTAEQMRMALEQFLVARNIIVSPSDIAALVRSYAGKEIEERRARIRHASTVLSEDAANFSSQPSASLTAMTVQQQPPPRRGMRRSTATAISLVSGGFTIAGLLVIAGISLGVPKKEAVAAAPTVSVAPPPAPTPAVPEMIVVKPVPTNALVLVAGAVVGPGEQKIARPAEGKSLTVEVRADGFESQTIKIDHESKVDLTVTLVAKEVPDAQAPEAEASAAAAPTPPPAATPAPTPTRAAPANTRPPAPANTRPTPVTTGGKTGGKTGGSKAPPAVPPNPF